MIVQGETQPPFRTTVQGMSTVCLCLIVLAFNSCVRTVFDFRWDARDAENAERCTTTMASEDENEIDFAGLDRLVKTFKNPPTVHVGILGESPRTLDGDGKLTKNNATVGLFAEVGTSKSPQRSFLRIPIATHLEDRLRKSGLLSEKGVRELMATGNLWGVMAKIGIICEGIVADAFSSGGFGRWVPSRMSGKKNKQTLVETAQLRNSVTSEVVMEPEE